jgi:hypothetical protein
MFFVSQHISADLSLLAPPVFCCNCGSSGELESVETPLKRVRYFFVFGTEVTLNQALPYCAGCVKTAHRVRQGWIAKSLAACMMVAALFLVLVLTAEFLPSGMNQNLFASSAIIGILLTLGYFRVQEWSRRGRTYYQPVSLIDVRFDNAQMGPLRLKFHNPMYAAVIKRANAERIRSGMLIIDADA